jgi:hypothetical protein
METSWPLIEKPQSSVRFVRSQNARRSEQTRYIQNKRHCRESGFVLVRILPVRAPRSKGRLSQTRFTFLGPLWADSGHRGKPFGAIMVQNRVLHRRKSAFEPNPDIAFAPSAARHNRANTGFF